MSKYLYQSYYFSYQLIQSYIGNTVKRSAIIVLLICTIFRTNNYATTIKVPSKITFANMHLHISKGAKQEIEKKIKSLTCSPRHYEIIFERINLYMPIIEQILKEEGLHEDFKYLVIQESTLLSDHISESNAVGFWQFKQEAATEVGMQINRHIDERMHIVESTRGFIKYVKKHHSHFNNWLYSLLAFYLGRGGTNLYIKEKSWHIKHTKASIDDRTHWYIYHFIAHKLVFEKVIGQKSHSELKLYEYKESPGKNLTEISQKFEVPLQNLKEYNKWLKTTQVPKDSRCNIFVPLQHKQYKQYKQIHTKVTYPTSSNKEVIDYASYYQHADKFPAIKVTPPPKEDTPDRGPLQEEPLLINGIPGVIAKKEDTLNSLAQRGNIVRSKFLAYNDITDQHQVQIGQIYYFQDKHGKGPTHYHITQPEETWWRISQKYGIKQTALLRKNRMRQVEELKPGQIVWLRFIRPADIPIAYEKEHNVAADIGTDIDNNNQQQQQQLQSL